MIHLPFLFRVILDGIMKRKYEHIHPKLFLKYMYALGTLSFFFFWCLRQIKVIPPTKKKSMNKVIQTALEHLQGKRTVFYFMIKFTFWCTVLTSIHYLISILFFIFCSGDRLKLILFQTGKVWTRSFIISIPCMAGHSGGQFQVSSGSQRKPGKEVFRVKRGGGFASDRTGFTYM